MNHIISETKIENPLIFDLKKHFICYRLVVLFVSIIVYILVNTFVYTLNALSF